MKPPENGATIVGDVTKFYLEGKEVSEEDYRAAFPLSCGVPMGTNAWNRPLLSDGLAVHPSQIDEANERNRRRGCSVTYDRTDGRAIIPDRGQRKKLLSIMKMHDRDGGYGDG